MAELGEDEGSAVRVPRWLNQGTAVAWRLLVLAAAVYVSALVLDRLPG